MRRNNAIVATLSIVTATFFAGLASAAEPASPPTADHAPVVVPVADGTKIGKSRSNIQNNREAPLPVKPVDPNKDPQQLVKPKTKSNQSND